ncbi:TetR-family transcriptional regulator [Streptomyces sp. L-9-10]|uniref:TetR/AcrR family transcriptional regulator n=1 Tax=Streptomyces sp. L-9-10 TaxID=1478131 RepID=UPI00101D5A0C|nr:TetR/AcrR family transcriptional regulator [Streptomyces sp. L-9-10]RYJ21834.1 TetR-family transcriptional regulator [Streptomyces sp. L-9-10]
MRADAARNRQRIFDEAHRAIATGEVTLTLNELARRSGVGVGTVYRLFPTQRAMLEAILEDSVRGLVAVATEAEQDPEPVRALIGFLHTALSAALAQPGLIDILITATDETDSLRQAKAELGAAASRLLERIQPAPALTGENLLKLLCGLIHAVNEHPADRQDAAADAYLRILQGGLSLSPGP